MTLVIPGQDEAIERILALAKFAKGAAASKLVLEALSAPNLYVYAEILACPNISALKSEPEFQSTYALLEIFSVKTLKEYTDTEAALPELNATQLKKLKQLTLVNYACKLKTLPYALLLEDLKISDIKELEDLITDSIFAGILVGKMNHESNCFEVQDSMARDVLPESYPSIRECLSLWEADCSQVLSLIDKMISEQKDRAVKKHHAQASFQKSVLSLKQEILLSKASKSNDDSERGRGFKHGFKGNRKRAMYD